MGTWGVAIFSDDIASDLRDEYRERLGNGASGPEATEQTLAGYADLLEDSESGLVVWLALAAAQSRVGRLEDPVRDRALQIIDGGGDLLRWADDPRLSRKRQAALLKLRAELVGPQRAPVRIPRPRYSEWPFEDGMLLAYHRSDDRIVIFRVVGSSGDRGGRYGLIEPLDWSGSKLPPAAGLGRLGSRAPSDWSASNPSWIMLIAVSGKGLDRFSVIGTTTRPVSPRTATVVTTAELDGLLERRYGL